MQSVYCTSPMDWASRLRIFSSLQKCSRCILHLQWTGPVVWGFWPLCRNAVGVFYILQWTGPVVCGFLPLCKDAVGVFYIPNGLGQLFEDFYLSAEMQSVYSTSPMDWASRLRIFTSRQKCSRCILHLSMDWTSRLRIFTSLQRCSRCILHPQWTGPVVWGFLPLCRNAVGVFYISNGLGQSFEDFYLSAEMQSVYSTSPMDWASRFRIFSFSAEMQSVYSTSPMDWASRLRIFTSRQKCSRCILHPPMDWASRLWIFTSLQRCSRCILHPQWTGPVVWGFLPLLQRCSRCILHLQ